MKKLTFTVVKKAGTDKVEMEVTKACQWWKGHAALHFPEVRFMFGAAVSMQDCESAHRGLKDDKGLVRFHANEAATLRQVARAQDRRRVLFGATGLLTKETGHSGKGRPLGVPYDEDAKRASVSWSAGVLDVDIGTLAMTDIEVRLRVALARLFPTIVVSADLSKSPVFYSRMDLPPRAPLRMRGTPWPEHGPPSTVELGDFVQVYGEENGEIVIWVAKIVHFLRVTLTNGEEVRSVGKGRELDGMMRSADE